MVETNTFVMVLLSLIASAFFNVVLLYVIVKLVGNKKEVKKE